MEDNWCIEEERKYIFGSTCDVFMPPAIMKLHEELIKEIESLEPFTKANVIKLINRKFGPKL